MFRGLVLALLVLEGVAGADPSGDALARARTAVAESDYGAARPALSAALDGGGRSPEELIEIYRLTGIVAAALGDPQAASDAFTRLLVLSPKAALPAGTSPKIKRPFDVAARYMASGHAPLQLKLETRAAPPMITLVRVSDPLGLVASARVTFSVDGGAERAKDVAASARTEIALPPGKRIDARIAALDRHGNRLIEIGSSDVPVVIVGEAAAAPIAVAKPRVVAPVPADRPARALPLWRRWWPYAAVSLAIGGAAAYFGYAARSDADELDRLNADSLHHSFDEALAVEDRARRHTSFANVGLVGAGVFAVTAGVMLVISPRHAEARVAAVPVAGGGALVLGGTF
jgi:hypothetical protein